MHVVLVEPEIPYNTGNIARTCAVTGTVLHLVKPLGFSVEDKYLKRAGLDYWHLVEIHYHESFDELRQKYPDNKFHFVTTKADRLYTEATYTPGDFLVFGKETAGLPEALLKANREHCIRIPMISQARSLNLSNAAAVVVFEVWRQQGFMGNR